MVRHCRADRDEVMATTLNMSDVLTYNQTQPAEHSARCYGLGRAMLWSVAIRAVIIAVGILSTVVADQHPTPSASGTAWVAWDGKHYADIIRHGYAATRDATLPGVRPIFWDIAFFPLLPFLAKPLTLLFSAEVSLVLIGNFCSIFSFAFIYCWLKNLSDTRFAFIGTLLIACWPGSVFFSAGLTEGPFMLIVAATLYYLQKREFWLAAVISGIGTLARPTGVALSCTVGLYSLIHLPIPSFPKRFAMSFLIGCVAISGALAYEAFLWNRFGSPTTYFEAQKYWELGDNTRLDAEKTLEVEGAVAPRYSPRWFLEKSNTPQAWNRIIAVGLLVLIIIGFSKTTPVPRELFALPLIIFMMTALPNHGLRASSILRYESGALPLFALMALWLAVPRRANLMKVFLIACVGLQVVYACYFSRGIWVG